MSEQTALSQIIEGVLADVQDRQVPINEIKARLSTAPKLRGAKAALSKSGTRLIAEIKRSSPSKGDLSQINDPALLAKAYENGGADLISVLTETRRFKGSILIS